jgi:hypothetical protein
MIIRDDLKNTTQYQNAVNRYKENVKTSIVFYMIIFAIFVALGIILAFLEAVGIAPEWLINFLYEEADGVSLGFLEWLIIFVVGEILIFLWNFCKLRNSFKILELFIDNKKIVETEDDTNYICYEGKKKYKVDNVSLYHNIQLGRTYCFLCRGRKILEIII